MNTAILQDDSNRGTQFGVCFFKENGCLETSSVLRPLQKPSTSTIEAAEEYAELADAVDILSDRCLVLEEVVETYA